MKEINEKKQNKKKIYFFHNLIKNNCNLLFFKF